MTGRARAEAMLTEADFQRRVLDTARTLGWRAVHVCPARIRGGKWITPYEGDSGLPDLVLARRGHVLLAELKTATGKPTLDQLAWLAAAGPHGHLWRPADWAAIVQALA